MKRTFVGSSFFIVLAFLIIHIALICVFTVSAVAESDVEFSLSSEFAAPGEEVELTLSVSTSKAINSIALSGFKYDTDALEFIAFENYDYIKSQSVLSPTFDKDKMAIVIGLKKAAYNTDICTLRFKVKEGAKPSTVTISATPLAKNSSTVLASSFKAGEVILSPVSVKGTSLVLDGSIGVKTYVSLDLSRVDAATVKANTSFYDTNFKETVDSCKTDVIYDSEKELYYFVANIAPKDADNIEIRYSLEYKLKGDDTLYTVSASPVSIPEYVEEFNQLANDDPASEYGKAVDLVNAMDSYSKYADSYFENSQALEDVALSDKDVEWVTDPKAEGAVSGIELYGTSLVLEDRTTIRHYFKVTDGFDASKYSFKVDGVVKTPVIKQGTDLVYVDIEDIEAHNLSKVFTLNVSDSMMVEYSALNYVKLAISSENSRLANLVKALYNYYKNANEYCNN